MTWKELDTRRGQLLEMGSTLSRAKDLIDSVMQDYPEEAHGSAWLEEAIGLCGRSQDEIDTAAEALHDEEGARR